MQAVPWELQVVGWHDWPNTGSATHPSPAQQSVGTMHAVP
jgi:hypothetical protein